MCFCFYFLYRFNTEIISHNVFELVAYCFQPLFCGIVGIYKDCE